MNSVETGDAFRDLVADLLRTQYQNVQVEQWINGTKVDVTFSQEDFGNLINFAVECKDYSTPLTKSYISEKIWTKYEPILQSGKIDRVLVVSRKSLGAAASAFVDGWRGASHQTYEEFAESLIGFKRYLQTLGALKPTDETPYVEARIEGRDQGAITVVDDWVACADSPAVAILGGYGQGKTSFAKRIAAEYAQRYLRDPTHRLPILLRLGEVVHETQLEGLFGKEFTARHHIKGYNFHALEHLNRLGRLLILLDGFDEMKHAMTAADFMANFLEFNRLLVPNAKVMLLGRPNALPSEERELVFRGKAKVGDSHVASAAFNRWDEWRLAFFSLGETEQLLAAHLSMLVKKYAGSNRYQYPADFIAKRVAEIIRKVPSDLLRRPVHVALIAEVGADPQFDLAGFNEYRLYQHFIRSMVVRDTSNKPARGIIPVEARLKFQRELAWWAWRRPGMTQGCFLRHDVPLQLLDELPDGNSVDNEGKRNEYIVSTLTEEKETGVLFFAHRSFQEFLVAERLQTSSSTPAAHIEYAAFITPDVVAFLDQSPTFDYLKDWFETLQSCSGPLTLTYLRLFTKSDVVLKNIASIKQGNSVQQLDVWSVLVLGLGLHQGAEIEFGKAWKLFLDVIKLGNSQAAAAATLCCVSQIRRRPATSGLLIVELSAALLTRCLLASHSTHNSNSLTIVSGREDVSTIWLGHGVTRVISGNESNSPVKLIFDLPMLVQFAVDYLTTYDMFANTVSATSTEDFLYVQKSYPQVVETLASQVFSKLESSLFSSHQKYLMSRQERFRVVSVKTVAPRRYLVK